jgi:hypothetical protein
VDQSLPTDPPAEPDPADPPTEHQTPWRPRPGWWIGADDRDRQAGAADQAAQDRDQAASTREEAAAERERDAAGRDDEAVAWIAAAQRRLIHAGSEDARRWADAIAAVEAARAVDDAGSTEETRAALIKAEAECEAETVQIIRSGIERHEIHDDLAHAAQQLAASGADRRAAATDRAHAQADRQAAAIDRATARSNRQQSAIERSGDSDIP